MSSLQGYHQLLAALNAVRQQWKRTQVLHGAILVVAGVLALLLLLVAIDNRLHLGENGRWIAALVLVLANLGLIASLVLRRCLDDRRDDFFAALVERRHPELRNQLINALQLGRGNQDGHSPRLIEAIITDAAQATADVAMTQSIDRQPLRRATRILAFVVAGIGLYALAFGPQFVNGLSRILLPGADIPPYTDTRIVEDSIRPADRASRFAEGDTITVEATVEGVIPTNATLHRRVGESRESLRMQPDAARPGRFCDRSARRRIV